MTLTAFAAVLAAPRVEATPDLGWQGATPLDSWQEGDLGAPELFIDPLGTAWAAWDQSEGTRWNIMANSFQPLVGHWDVPTAVQNGPFDGYVPSICADGAGNAMAVWNTWDGQRWSVHWSQYLRGFGWSAGTAIDDPAAFNTDAPRISCNDAGVAVAVWTQYDGSQWSMYANVYRPGSAWAGARHIDPAAGLAESPRVAVDPSGNAVALWLEWSIGKWRVASAWYQSGLGWWSRGFVEANPGDAAGLSLGIESGGNAVAVWRQWDGVRFNAWANVFDEGTVNWGTATLIETSDNPVYYYEDVRVSVNSTGYASAVWTQSDGTYWSIYANSYDPVSDTWGAAIPALSMGTSEYDPDVALTLSGITFILFREADTVGNTHIIAAQYRPGLILTGSWMIEGFTDTSVEPRVAVDSLGNAMTMWMQYSETEKRYSLYSMYYDSTSGWIGSPMKVEFDDEGWAGMPRLAVNTGGAAVAAFTRDEGPVSDVYGTIYSPATGWSAATLLETDNRGDALDPALGIDDAGNAVVIWRQWDGAEFVIYSNRYLVGLGWTLPKQISTVAGDALAPQIAVNGGGQGFGVWRTWDGVTKRLWAAQYSTSSGWDAPVLVDASVPNDILDPVVAIDNAGESFLVDSIWDGTQYSIYAYRYDIASGWGSAKLIENLPRHSFSPQIAMNGAGRAIVTWNNLDGAHYSVYAALFIPGTGWAPETLIEALPGETYVARNAIDAYGNAFATWQQWDGTMWNAFIVRYDVGSGWGSPMPLATFLSTTVSPYVGMNRAGDAVVMFSEVDGRRTDIGYLYSAYARHYTYGTGWGPTQLLETGAGDAWAGEVALDGAGDAIVTFLQYDGVRLNPWANRYVVGDGAPSLVLMSPTTYLTNNANIFVSGTTDPGVTLTVDGIPVTVDSVGVFSYSVTLPEGLHRFIVVAKNLAGLTREATADVLVDLTPPSLTILSPADGSMFKTPTISVKGSSEPAASLVVNGIAVRPESSGSFSVNVSLKEGSNMITVTATDEAGNSKTASVTVTLDTIAPALVVTSPSGGITSNPNVNVMGQTEVGATVTINGTPVFVDPLGGFSMWVTLPDGQHSFVVVASDAVGNSATQTAQVTVDTKAPTLLITSPADGTLTRDPLVTVWGQTEPDARVVVNGFMTLPDVGGNFVVRLTLHEGLTAIQTIATDPAGNIAGITISVTVDTIPPVLAVAGPKDGTLTNNANVLVSGYTDSDANVTIDGTPVTVSPSGVFSRSYTLPEGQHLFDIVATDPAGNVNRAAVSVTIDLTAPTVAIITPADGSTTSTPTVIVSGTTEPGVSLTVNGYVVDVDQLGGFSVPLALQAGSNLITATAADAAGNTATDSVTVTYLDPVPWLQQQLSDMNNALNQTRDELRDTRDALSVISDTLNQTKDDLRNARDALNDTRDQLSDISDTLNHTRDQLNSTADQLADTRDTLNTTATTLNNMNNDLSAARADISRLSSQMLILIGLLVVSLLLAVAQFVMGARMRARGGEKAPSEEEEGGKGKDEEEEEDSDSK